MKQQPKRPVWGVATNLMVAIFLSTGCDQVGTVVDDVKSSVTGEAKEPAAETTAATAPATPPTPPQPATPPPPTPEELLAEFNSLKPNEISDSSLARVSSSPEATAAITSIDIQGSSGVSGNGLRQLAAMKNLASLNLSSSVLKPNELAGLGTITSLKEIQLNGSQADDSVIGQLASLPNLEALHLSGTKISPAAAASFAQIKNLAVLDLQSTQTDDNTVAALAQLPIRELNLSRTRITNASLSLLTQIPTLESLNVSFTQVTGAGFKGFNRTGIKTLNVGETQFGIDGFVAIKGMKSLEDLNIYRAGLIENTKANVFKTFPKLRILNAGANSVTNAGMKVFFKGHRTLEELILSNNKGITDQGLAELIGVKTLKLLTIHGTGCGAQGARALKQRLPECTIVTSEGTF